jgi:hypothetical protein
MNIIEIEKSEDKEIIIRTSSVSDKIKYVRQGFFLDILYQDTNPEVRIEVAKKSAYLEELKKDTDYKIKFEVLKNKGLDFMEFEDINKEHISIIQEAVNQGYNSINLDYSNCNIKLIILKEKGVKYCTENQIVQDFEKENLDIKKEMVIQGYKLNKNQIIGELGFLYLKNITQIEQESIIANLTDRYILKKIILNGYDIQHLDSKKFSNLFRDKEFRIECIKKGYYLRKILYNYDKDIDTLIYFVKYGFIDFSFFHNNRNYTLIEELNKRISFDIIKSVKKYAPLKIKLLKYDENIFDDIKNKEAINKQFITVSKNLIAI